MDALDMLADFASFLASSKTIPKTANTALDAQKPDNPSHSKKRHEQPATTPLSTEQALRRNTDQMAMTPHKSVPIEAYPLQPLRLEQLSGNNEATSLNMQPMFGHSEQPEGPGSYVEPYAIEHATNVWNPQDHFDGRQAPPLWIATHEYDSAVQPDRFTWAPNPFFRTIPGIDDIGQMLVAGNEIYQSPCSMGVCNCRKFPPGFANPITMSPYERYDAGILFGDNARGSPIELSMQWR